MFLFDRSDGAVAARQTHGQTIAQPVHVIVSACRFHAPDREVRPTWELRGHKAARQLGVRFDLLCPLRLAAGHPCPRKGRTTAGLEESSRQRRRLDFDRLTPAHQDRLAMERMLPRIPD
jgi:hypothetical protein